MFEEVRVVDKNRQTVKEGIVVKLTTKGAHVYNPRASDEKYYTDSVFFAEWFPYESPEIRILSKKRNHRRKKV